MGILEYQSGRGAEYPKAFLKGWRGYLHTDGWNAYHKFSEGIVVVGCLTHAKRKFGDALNALHQENRDNSGPLIGKKYCDNLFAIEQENTKIEGESK